MRAVACPVIVVHGAADVICLVIHAEHIATIVPDADLRVFDELGEAGPFVPSG